MRGWNVIAPLLSRCSVSSWPEPLVSKRLSSTVGVVVLVFAEAVRYNPEKALALVFDRLTRREGCESVVGGGAKKGIAILGSKSSSVGEERWRWRRRVRSALRRVSRV